MTKRAQFFVTCSGRMQPGLRVGEEALYRQLAIDSRVPGLTGGEQTSLFEATPQLLLGGM